MKGDLFTHEVSQTSTVFGRKKDVNVVFQGDSAGTDGGTIVLPSINLNGEVTDNQAEIIRGYVDHEAGHIRHSDMDAIHDLYRKCEADGNHLLRAVHNALEDVWLERRVRDEYPGAERNLIATTKAVNERFLQDVPAGDPRLTDDLFVSAVALTWEGRKGYQGDTKCQDCLDLLDSQMQTALGRWVSVLDGCNNTRDVIALAREVERQLRTGEHRGEPKPEEGGEEQGEEQGRQPSESGKPSESGDQPGEQGQPDEHGEPGEQGEQGDPGEQPGEPGEPGDQPGEPGQADQADQEPESSAPGGSYGEAIGGHKQVYEAFDLANVVEEVAKQGDLGKSGRSDYRPLSTAHDRWHHRKDESNIYGPHGTLAPILRKGTRETYSSIVDATGGLTNIMRRKLERALMSKQQRDWDYGREAGRLDSRRLASAYAAKPNVFKARDDRAEMDTALTLLIDLSGSMDVRRKATIAQQVVISMCEAIDRTGIEYEVLGFNNVTSWIPGVPRPTHDRWLHGNKYSRVTPLHMYIFKAFDERLNEAKGPLSTIDMLADGDNSDGEALLCAFDRLRQRNERRKVMIVFSDGMPVSYGDFGNAHLRRHLKDVVKQIQKSGVDVMGVGIKSDAVSEYYPEYVVVEDLEDLAASALDIMARSLMGDRFVVNNEKLKNDASS